MKKERIPKKYYIDWYSVAPGVWGIKDIFVNIYLIHNPSDRKWVLVDAGLKTSAAKIRKVAEHLFWPEITPSSIILTHAHFDHVGSLRPLADEWNVPVYAHAMEEPYLTGKSSYPPPDPTVGGGMMSWMSCIYPKGPINVEDRLKLLPDDGSVPGLPEWKYIHTPGHAPGHISLYRKHDGVLIAGDAFVTTCAESAISSMLQTKKMSGPPKYFTYNWTSAASSVKKLAALNPQVVATGHGRPMKGEEMRRSLHNLADNFEATAVPSHGRYVEDPALVNKEGVQYVPPTHSLELALKVAGIVAATVMTFFLVKKRIQKPKRVFKFSYN
jgi:glyoxylase-like metal-dependent hydrolase (beta-lactamase superfamily II)